MSRSYVFGYEKDNPSYEYLKTKIFNESSEENYIAQETIYTFNLETAKKFFIERLNEIPIDQIGEIYKKLTQHFLFNIYTISNDIDVFITFETMNNRGKPLSLLELLKNRLIYLTTKFNQEDYLKDSLRKKINECWKTIYHNLGKNKINPLDDDTFLYNHMLLYFGDTLIIKDEKRNMRYLRGLRYRRFNVSDFLLESKFSAKRIKNEEDTLTINEINNYVESLQSYVEIWYKINNPFMTVWSNDEKTWLDRLNRLEFNSLAPLLLVFYNKVNDEKVRIRLLKSIEKVLFANTIVSGFELNYRPDEFNVQAVDFYEGRINQIDILNKFEALANSIYKEKVNIDKIKKELKRDGYYNWEGIKYFFYEYEQYLHSKTKTNSKKLNWEVLSQEREDFVTIEHIYPQTAKKDCWTNDFCNFTQKQRNILKDTLGNLVTLSQPKNSSLQNNCFIDKIGDEKNLVGFKYGSLAEIELTNYETWTAQEILSRGIKLIKFMESNWEIDFENDESRIEILGLDFL